MNHCENCIFWQPATNNNIKGGFCTRVVTVNDATTWDNKLKQTEMRPEYQNHLAFIDDPSVWHSRFFTKPDFGCLQWCAID